MRQRPGNFHHLLVRNRQVTNLGPGIETHLEALQNGIRTMEKLRPVDKPEAFVWQFTEVGVLGNRQFGCQAEFLMNEYDTLVLCFQW